MSKGLEEVCFKEEDRGCQAPGEDEGGRTISYTENDETGFHQVDFVGSVLQTESDWYSDVVLYIFCIT